MPTISVVIPAYNGERTILETIASVQQQTCSDFELIVINDGSTDQTLELLHSIKEPRLKIFSYENAGLDVTRNRCLAHAAGEFITFLDQDDLWTTDKLELQLSALQKNPEAGVAYSWTCNMAEKGEWFQPGKQASFEGNVLPQLLIDNFIANGSNPLIRKQAIETVGEFDPQVSPCGDWDYFLRLAAQWSFVVVPKVQILYRQTSNSVSSKVKTMEKATIKVIEKAFQSAPPELQYLKNQSLATMYQYLAGICLLRVNHIKEAQLASQKLQMAIRLHPPILIHRLTQRYAMKCLIMQLLPLRFAKNFTRWLSQIFNMNDPRLQQKIH
jgi:glycosyltransferase involved in cell wall biosynthesis